MTSKSEKRHKRDKRLLRRATKLARRYLSKRQSETAAIRIVSVILTRGE